MRYLLLIVMFVSTAAAQEFAVDADAMGRIVEGTRALKVKHDGRPRPPFVGDYEASGISFKLITKSIELYYKESLLATLDVNDEVRGWGDAERVLKAFESLRDDALAQKRRIVINYDAIQRQNKARAWSSRQNPNECELFDEVIRLGRPHASHATAKLLHDIEKTKGLIQKYRDDPTRAGIYNAELSLLHLKLALAVPASAACPDEGSLSAPWIEHAGSFPTEAFQEHLRAGLDGAAALLLPVNTVSWWLGVSRRGRGNDGAAACLVLGSAAFYANGPENAPVEDVGKIIRTGGEARLWPVLMELRWFDPKDGRKHRWFNETLSKTLGWSTDGRGRPTETPRPVPLPDASNELFLKKTS